MTMTLLLLTQLAYSQAPATAEQARVPTSYANVHAAPGSGSVPLVLVPRGTVLPVIGRRGEWVQVQLSPELRKTGMVMRVVRGRASDHEAWPAHHHRRRGQWLDA